MTSILSETEMLKRENKKLFEKLDYEFEYFCSLRFGKVKLSLNHIAFLSFPGNEFYILEDKEKCAKIFNDFLVFAKNAKKAVPPRKGVETGVVCEGRWANKFKYFLKKIPNLYETQEYLFKVLEENNLLDEKTLWNNVIITEENFNEKLTELINKTFGEDEEFGKLIFDIVLKVKELPTGTVTTIAELINYDAKNNFVEPVKQFKVLNSVINISNLMKMNIVKPDKSLGGLGYHVKIEKY